MPRKRPKSERDPGRPYRARALWERTNIAEWLEERVEEHREEGSKKPHIEAALDFLQFVCAGDIGFPRSVACDAKGVPKAGEIEKLIADEERFNKFVKKLKELRRTGRREIQMLKDIAERRNSYLRTRNASEEEEEDLEVDEESLSRPPKYPPIS